MLDKKVSWNKSIYTVHGWLGLNFGLALFIICLSGTFAVVSHEIDWLMTPALRVAPERARASYGDMYRAVQEKYPGVPIRSAWAPKGPRFACEFWVSGPSGGNRRVYVNPYTAEVQGEGAWFNTQRFFRDFHRRFFWHAWWGIWLVAAFGFVLFAASATGLTFYKRWWAKLFTLRWGKGGRQVWSDLHRLAGVWTLLFSLLIAVTGIWYFIEIPLSWNFKPPRLPKLPQSSIPSEGSTVERLPVDEWVRVAQESIPELEVGTIWFPAKQAAVVRIDGQATAWLVRDRANKVLVDPYTGNALFHQRAEQLSPYWRWVDMADPLHFGDFGGLASKLVWFVFGLALSVLMPTGAYLWTRRAAQTAASTEKRLQKTAGVLTDAERARHIRWATRRQTMLGLVSTTGILLLACYATYGALAKQAAAADPSRTAVWHLGGAGAIAVYGSFTLLILLAAVLWYRCVWFWKYRSPTSDTPGAQPLRR